MGGGETDTGLVLTVKTDTGEFKLAPVVTRAPFNAGEQLATAAFPLFKITLSEIVPTEQPSIVD